MSTSNRPSKPATHTPGPWEYEFTSSSGRQLDTRFRITTCDGEYVAGTAYVSKDDAAYAEVESVARLIAAAPEMLEVLKHIEETNGELSMDVLMLVSQLIERIEGGGK